MREYTRPQWINKAPKEYQEIFELHDKWLNNIDGGQRANLYGANLQNADLQKANLGHANLQRTNLQGANLYEANLQWANLYEANLQNADLQNADLRWANLQDANLIVLKIAPYDVFIGKDYIRIGGKLHTAKDWFAFNDDEIEPMAINTLDWWEQWKPIIRAAHKALVKGRK